MNRLVHHLIAQLKQAQVIDTAQAAVLAVQPNPWWLQVLMGFAAWIASLFIISSLFGPILAITDADIVRAIIAAALMACAFYLAKRPHDFLQQMSVAFALAAQGLLVYVISEQNSEAFDSARNSCIVLSSLLWFSPLNQLHRRISMAIAIACAISLIEHAAILAVVAVFVQAACIVLWCQRQRWVKAAYASHLRSLLPLLTLTSIALAFLLQALTVTDYHDWLQGNVQNARNVASAGFAAMLLAVAIWLSRHASLPSRLAIVFFTFALLSLLFSANALVVTTTLLLCCFYATALGWVMLLLLLQLLALGQYYYSLQLNLLEKSGLLALAAILLFIGWALVERYKRRMP